MQFFTLIISALAATALAVPTEPKPTTTTAAHHPAPTETKAPHPGQPGGGSYDPCPKSVLVNAIPQCCAVNLLGLISLDCKAPSAMPTSAKDFQSICKKTGAQAQCCTIPTLGQGLVCAKPAGVY